MEKVINSMPSEGEKVKADVILEINDNHPISKKLKALYKDNDKKEIANYTKILYNIARLQSGLNITDGKEVTELICNLLSK